MELYAYQDAKTKTGQIRVTKSIGALLIDCNKQFSHLSHEKITMHIERSNGSNEEICTNISLKAFIALSVFGKGQIFWRGSVIEFGFTSVAEISENGAIKLAENESLLISLTDLDPLNSYGLNGIEYPIKTNDRVYFTEKILLAGQKNREFDVSAFDEGFISGSFQKVRLTYETTEGDSSVEYSYMELLALASDFDILVAGQSHADDEVNVSLVGVKTFEIFSLQQVNITLRKA